VYLLRMEGSEDVEKAAHLLKLGSEDGILPQTPLPSRPKRSTF
jgi:hypothetical protein